MSINVNWLGDGWTYYTNEERRQMERKANEERQRKEAMNALAVECIAWSCVPIPLRLAVKVFMLVHTSALPSQEREDLMNLIAEFEGMILDANAANQNYHNN